MFFVFALTSGQAPLVRASRPPTPLRGLGERVFVTKAYRLVTKGFCVWALHDFILVGQVQLPLCKALYAQKPPLIVNH